MSDDKSVKQSNGRPGLSALEELIAKVIAIDLSSQSEQATREIVVNRIIEKLGWDTLNPGEVAREYPVLGGKVDYCLRVPKPKRDLVLIEVKRVDTDLGEHQEQLLRYAFDAGAPLAVLTNGLLWWLYLPMADTGWEQRRFSRIDFRKQGAATAAADIYRFLNRHGVIDGTSQEEARQEFESQERDRRVRVALQEAWRHVLGDPKGLLRDLLSETVQEISGDVPDPREIAKFLEGILGNGSTGTESPTAAPRTEDRRGPERDPERSLSKKRSAIKAASRPTRKQPRRGGEYATKRMSARVEGNLLVVAFKDEGISERWALPDRSNKEEIRRIRDEATTFAHKHGASRGQVDAAKKALTEAGFWLTK